MVNLSTGVCSLFTNINRNILIQYTKGMLQLKSRLNANHHPAEVILTQQLQAICVKKCLKELSIWNKVKYLNLNIFRTRCCKPLIFQTQII